MKIYIAPEYDLEVDGHWDFEAGTKLPYALIIGVPPTSDIAAIEEAQAGCSMSIFLVFPQYYDDYTGPRPPVIVVGPAPDDEAARFLAEDGLGTTFAGGDSIRCTAGELTFALRILR